jgi:mannose-6-phosphate isomerase-like protein (cupin superfamily)
MTQPDDKPLQALPIIDRDARKAIRLDPIDMARRLPRPPTAKWPDGEFDVTVLDRCRADAALFFAPRGCDHQTAHDCDELYIVVSGTGILEAGDETLVYSAGDLLFVPRQTPHRFVSPGDDLALWVIFLPE